MTPNRRQNAIGCLAIVKIIVHMPNPNNENAMAPLTAADVVHGLNQRASWPAKWRRWRQPAVRLIIWLLAVVMLYVIVEFKTVLFFEYLHSPHELVWKAYGVVIAVFLLSRFVIADLYHDEHPVDLPDSIFPSVSVIVAAKNEVGNIFRTISTIMHSVYPGPLECIAVNDGSTDGTGAQMAQAASECRIKNGVTIITFPVNQGKRQAMAAGIKAAKGEIIIFVDSDSFVAPDGIRDIVEHFIQDERIGAVTGNTGVENRDVNVLTRMQSARYGVAYDIFKVCESIFGVVTCCSGCFSAYRRSAVVDVVEAWRTQTFFGSPSTFGDDRSLTNYVLRRWRVIYCRRAYATTVVPEKFMPFLRQQLRWKKSWVREGTAAAKFMWRKHPIASWSFYTNLILPVVGPIVVFHGLLVPLAHLHLPGFYLGGVVALSALFGLFYRLRSWNTTWWYVMLFSLVYVFVLVWQMPYALVRLTDTSWGTR